MKKRSKILRVFLVLLVLLFLAGWATWRVIKEQTTLEVNFYQVQSSKVSNNVRVVLLTDLHLQEFGTDNVELVSEISKLTPDIIAIAGDMNIHGNEDYSVVLTLCEQLVEIAPVYYSLGNHEYVDVIFNDSNIIQDLRDTGVTVLPDASAEITVGETEILIGGLSEGPEQFEKYGREFFDAFIADSRFKLLLVHYPEEFDGVLEDYPIDLALCGHAHGGQIRLPFIGGLYSADQGFFPKLAEGYHEIGNSKVIISRGLGSSNPVPRINNTPEIVVVDINWY